LQGNFMDFPLQNYPGDASVFKPTNQDIPWLTGSKNVYKFT
jgi:hypothetical protein